MKVLLLDDNLLSSTRLQRALETQGHQVQIAAKPDVSDSMDQVLINLGSRSLPGIELISQCHGLFPGVTVNGFCGHLEIEIRRAAKAAGINKIFTNDKAFSGELT
jgi:DNA-binding NarL/FixJ family response regulator